jgi:signal transduction histidine kinase
VPSEKHKMPPVADALAPDGDADVVDPLTARLGALARRASTSEALLEKAVGLVMQETGATTCGLYLCDTSSVALIHQSDKKLTFVREAILLTSLGPHSSLLPDRVEFEGDAEELQLRLNGSFAAQQSPTSLHTVSSIPFFQDGELRGTVAILNGEGVCIDPPSLTRSFNEFCVMLELVTDRYLQRTLVNLNAKCLMLLSDHPQHCMCAMLAQASKMIGCDGISFFALNPFDDSDVFHLVATYPNAMPIEDVGYARDENTLTSRILACDRDCVVHYPTTERSQLAGLAPPKWRDVDKETKSETVIYVRLLQADETVGLLRCTNRANKTPSHWFNWIDVRRAKSLASLLLPYYKAAQKEDRFAGSLSDISHEIKTMAGSIRYTAQNIRDQVAKFGHSKIQDVLLKLGHIERAAKSLRALLPALRMEAATPPAGKEVAPKLSKGFRPYADLCKPIAEMYIQEARKRQIAIEHFGQDQLGLIYADIGDFKHIIENLLSNAVKYTNYGTPIYIRYERQSSKRQFASIHIASASIPIRADEADFIFKYRQRAIAAKNSKTEGEGIGLAIARAKARQYNGDVVYRPHGDINMFTVLIPRGLFHPPQSQTAS